MAKNFEKNLFSTAYLLLDKIFVVISSFLIQYLAVISLSKEDWGTFISVNYYYGLIGTFLTLSLNEYVLKKLTESKNTTSVISTAIFLQLVSTIFVLALINFYFYVYLDDQLFLALACISAIAIITRKSQITEQFFKVNDKGSLVTKSRFISRISASAYILFIFFNGIDILSFAYWVVIDSLIYHGLLLFYYFKNSGRVSFAPNIITPKIFLKDIWREVISKFLISFALAFPIVLLSSYDKNLVADIGVIIMVMALLISTFNLINESVYRKMSDLRLSSKKDYHSLLSFFLITSFLFPIILIIILNIFNLNVFSIIFGERYSNVQNDFYIYLYFMPIILPTLLVNKIVFMENIYKSNFKRFIPASVITIILSFPLVSELKVSGVIFSIAFFYITSNFIFLIFIKEQRQILWLFLKQLFRLKNLNEYRRGLHIFLHGNK
mgnify:CR=1 FL=1|tara:strand:- start:14209 stop:15522 length:1314 start_codon:yes stop_codon:yes gene_type:complete